MRKLLRKTGLLLVGILILSALSVTSACSSKSTIQTGEWSGDGQDFTNDWSGIRFTLPAGWRVLSEDEVKAVMSAGEEVLISNGKKTVVDTAKMKTVFDTMLSYEDNITSVGLQYENLALSINGAFVDAKGYWDITVKQLVTIDALQAKELEAKTAAIAGSEYYMGKISIGGGLAYQNYYFRKVDKAMITLLVTYTDDTKAEVEGFIASFK